MDENSAITLCAIRRLVKDGRIKSVKSGRKTLINFDELLEYLANPFQDEPPVKEQKTNNITPIGPDRMEAFKRNISQY
jgi:excisionase family DNA binding protein